MKPNDKQTVTIINAHHIECHVFPYEGKFSLTFFGTTEKGKRHKIEVKLRLYFVSCLSEKLLMVKRSIESVIQKEFSNFK